MKPLCAGRKVISADTRIVKIWDAADGAPYTSIEPQGAGDINDVCVWPDSGCAAPPKQRESGLRDRTQRIWRAGNTANPMVHFKNRIGPLKGRLTPDARQ